MIPASFAPMILKLVMPKVTDHLMKVFKLDKVLQYVEQPNEADLMGEKNKEEIRLVKIEREFVRKTILAVRGGK